MISNKNKVLICINILAFILGSKGQDLGTTVNTLYLTNFLEKVAEMVTMITDIPEEDVEEALNVDYGRYTTQSFAYFNSQIDTLPGMEIVPCFDSHIKCLLTVVVPHPVCTVNNAYDLYEGYRTFETYCDAYFDNCLRKMRFWRILDFGKCVINWDKKELKGFGHHRRSNSQNFKNLFNLPSKEE